MHAMQVSAVAQLCGQAFGQGNFEDIDSAALQELERKYALKLESQVNEKLPEALAKKRQVRSLSEARRQL